MTTTAPQGPLAGLIADARLIPAPFQPRDRPAVAKVTVEASQPTAPAPSGQVPTGSSS